MLEFQDIFRKMCFTFFIIFLHRKRPELALAGDQTTTQQREEGYEVINEPHHVEETGNQNENKNQGQVNEGKSNGSVNLFVCLTVLFLIKL